MSRRLSTALLALILLPAAARAQAPAAPEEPARHLVEVFLRDAHDVDRLLALGLDLVGEGRLELPSRSVEAVATDADLALLARAGFGHTVHIRDLARFYAERLAAGGLDGPNPPFGSGGMGGYHTFAEVVKLMDDLHQTFPAVVSAKWSIGKSWEGRDLWAVKISDNVNIDENEPEVHFDALIHAREPMAMTCTVALMYWLAEEYGKDPLATRLVDEREMFFVPVVNPDGYEYNRATTPGGGGMWRKNRRDNGGGVFGVDLNRNWPYQWGGAGASTSPSSDTYRGPSPASEPEIQALMGFFSQRRFVTGLNAHTYQNLLLRPWGYVAGDPPNAAEYDVLGAIATRENRFPYGACGKLLYLASGGSHDTYHANYGMYGFVCEIGSTADGFWPPASRILPLMEANAWMFRALALTVADAVEAEVVAVTEVAGNANNRLDPGETAGIEVKVVNHGAGAAPADVVASLAVLPPGSAAVYGSHNFGKLGKFLSAANTATPLTLKVPGGGPGIYNVEVAVQGSWRATRLALRLVVGDIKHRLLFHDDAEADLGWEKGLTGDTALRGRWNQMPPQQTTSGGVVYQPGADTTPAPGTACFVTDGAAGTAAGDRDVDNGFTTLLTPAFALAHADLVEFRYQRWFTDSQNHDVLRVAVSVDGGKSWQPLEGPKSPGSVWTPVRVELPAALKAGAETRLRFVAEDTDPQGLNEACIDDLEIWGWTLGPSLVAVRECLRGKVLRLGRAGEAGATGLLLAGAAGGPVAVPGFDGALRLDPLAMLGLDVTQYGTGGYVATDLAVPPDPALAGGRISFQEVVFKVQGGGVTGAFSNPVEVAIR